MVEEGVVIVTGASKGVGRATATALVRDHGAHVMAIARDGKAITGLAVELEDAQGVLEGCVMDLADAEAPARVARAVGARRVRALVNNAGLLIKRPFGEWTAQDMLQLYAINVVVPVQLVQALRGRLEGTPSGHVVNISSMGGVQGSVKFPGLLGYSASKGALITVTECLAEELKVAGIKANCLCLGAVDTEMLRSAFPGYQAPVSAAQAGAFIARFVLDGANLFNGKVLEMAVSTP